MEEDKRKEEARRKGKGQKRGEPGWGGEEQGDKREERGAHERTHTEEDKLEKSILQDNNYTNTTTALFPPVLVLS